MMKKTLTFKWFRFLLVTLVFIAAPVLAEQQTRVHKASSTEIVKGVHIFSGVFAGVLAVTGSTGVLLVDAGPPWHAEDVQRLVDELEAGQVQVVINTHFHFDHIANTEAFARNGAIVVAHENTGRRMQEAWSFPEAWKVAMPTIPAFPEVALPTVIVIDKLAMEFGGHRIEVLHFPGAHSDADLVVFLPDVNILHTGDLFVSNGIQPVDTFHGGSVDGMVTTVGKLIDMIDDDTKVIPGHGPVSNRQQLREYQQMIKTGRDRIAALVAQGKSLDDVVAENPVEGLYTRGKPQMRGEGFMRTVYAELAGWTKPAGPGVN